MATYKRKADCTPEEWERFRARRREWERKKRKEDPEWEKRRREQALKNNPDYKQERNRRKYERILADPEKHARRLAIVRKSEAKRRMRQRVQKNPKKYLRQIRKELGGIGAHTEDMVSETLLILLEGKASTVEDAVSMGKRNHWQLFSTYRTLSLDTSISGEAGGERFIDRLVSEENRVW